MEETVPGLWRKLLRGTICSMLVTGKMWECDKCGWRWMFVETRHPKRCASCKSRKWDRGGGVETDRKPVQRKAENTMAKTAEKHIPLVKPEPVRVETPKQEMPAPKCPRCREEMVDLGPEFSCGNENCSQKPIPRETIEYQFENRGQ
jgi:predicted Zn-ribbon and HTH transcriptional regulator